VSVSAEVPRILSKEHIERALSAESALAGAWHSVEKLYEIAEKERDTRRLDVLGDIRAKVQTASGALVGLYS
jgi:hypothetical protein